MSRCTMIEKIKPLLFVGISSIDFTVAARKKLTFLSAADDDGRRRRFDAYKTAISRSTAAALCPRLQGLLSATQSNTILITANNFFKRLLLLQSWPKAVSAK